MNDKSPKYLSMYQELPAPVAGYTINLGRTKKEWHVFVCNSAGVPVVVDTLAGKLTEHDAYLEAQRIVQMHFGN